ncbi:Peptidoglycan/xylan/chitin deacetylase (PgdA/CDA1 family) OS=Streptomyces albaduncus OX=68172 GN=FHS32_000657 PE=4 SV=1 [Streptomyces griseoloalbus]
MQLHQRRPAHNYPGWRQADRHRHIYPGFQRAHTTTNRAPFFVGNHFEQWNGGIYMDAVEQALTHIAREKEKGGDVRIVSFRQFCDWLDVQKPEMLDRLRTLDVGQEPTGGWQAFTRDLAGATPTGAADPA